MSDIRFNQWLHQSGTGGVSQDHIGNIGIGTTNPSIVVSAANTAVLNVGVITANNLFVNNAFNGDITGNVTGNISGATGTFSGNVDIADKIIHTGDTDTAMRFPADNTFAVDTAGSERLRITSTGVINCGHGDNINLHSSTTTGINLNGNGNSGQIVANASGNRALIIGRQASYGQVIEFFQGTNANDAAITIPAADSFGIETAGTERLRITSSGNLGINKTPETDWSGSYRAIEIGNSSVSGYQGNTYPSIELNMNCRGTAASYSSGWKYIRSMKATQIHMPYSGEVKFRRANSGSADGAITWSESMRIDDSGRITTPDQPAFNAKLSAATGANFNGTLVFNTVQYNIGNHYNGTNGRFTAPVDGRYLFNWYTNVNTDSNATSLWGDWLINGSYSGFRFYTYVSHGGWELLTASIIFDLNSGDYVNVWVSTSGNYDGGQYGSFNGCLLG